MTGPRRRLQGRSLAAIFAIAALVVVGFPVWLLSGFRNPFRNPRLAENEFRALLNGLSSETTRGVVRDRLHGYDELRSVDSPGSTRVWLRPHLWRREGWDMTAQILYGPTGHVFQVEAFHPTSTDAPVAGIPRTRCLVPPEECKAILDASFRDAGRRRSAH